MKETSPQDLEEATLLEFTSPQAHLPQAYAFVVTLPIPIDPANHLDLTSLEKTITQVHQSLRLRAEWQRSKAHGSMMPVVIYESTVNPGVIQEIFVPILDREWGLPFN